jgi:Zn-dependent protease
VNLVITGVLNLILRRFQPMTGTEVQNPGIDMLTRLAAVNLFLVLFNAIPAFPMYGGRVLRALLAYRMGSPAPHRWLRRSVKVGLRIRTVWIVW